LEFRKQDLTNLDYQSLRSSSSTSSFVVLIFYLLPEALRTLRENLEKQLSIGTVDLIISLKWEIPLFDDHSMNIASVSNGQGFFFYS